MARILLIHHDKGAREILTVLLAGQQVEAAKDLKCAMHRIIEAPPDVVVAGQDSQDEGLRLLRWLRETARRCPVILVLGRGGQVYRPAALKLGAAAVLDMPVDRTRLNAQVAAVVAAAGKAASGPPPLSEVELKGNLSILETKLNHQMLCVAGRNQVFIQSTVLGSNTPTRPRICLKCSLRAEYGLPREVYYDHISDICCHEPGKCEAVQRFEATRDIA